LISEKEVRIIILLGAPLTRQNYERIGVPELSKHFTVKVLDCNQILGRIIKYQNSETSLYTNSSKVESIAELKEEISNFWPNFVLDHTSFAREIVEILPLLKKLNARLVLTQLGNLPAPTFVQREKVLLSISNKNAKRDIEINQTSKIESIKILILSSIFYRIIKRIKSRFNKVIIERKVNKFQPFIGVIAGNKALQGNFHKCKPIIWSGSQDFHIFREEEKAHNSDPAVLIKYPFILFVDENLPDASDWVLLNTPPPVTRISYFEKLDKLFQRVEELYGVPVIVAGHPREQNVEGYVSKFNGRQVLFGRTARLTLEAQIVLTFASTAVSFAILAKKPIVFLALNEMRGHRYGADSEALALSLGYSQVFIDNLENLKNDLSRNILNQARYDLYMSSYLCYQSTGESGYLQNFIDYVIDTTQNANILKKSNGSMKQ
jgi:hypothetical protein